MIFLIFFEDFLEIVNQNFSTFLETFIGSFSTVRLTWTLRKKQLETHLTWNVHFWGKWICLFCGCYLPQMELWSGTSMKWDIVWYWNVHSWCLALSWEEFGSNYLNWIDWLFENGHSKLCIFVILGGALHSRFSVQKPHRCGINADEHYQNIYNS